MHKSYYNFLLFNYLKYRSYKHTFKKKKIIYLGNQGGQIYFQIPQGILSNAQPDTRITLPPVQLPVQQQQSSVQVQQASVQVQQSSEQVQQSGVQNLQPIQPKASTSGNQRNKPDSDDEFLKGKC